MSNEVSEIYDRSGEIGVNSADPERTQRISGFLGACTIVRLSDELTFNDIFEGSISIDEASLIYDSHGEQLDTIEILSQIS